METQSLENSSEDTQKLILNKLSPLEAQNLFIASKKLKLKFDTENFWIEKAEKWNQEKIISAKEQCLSKWKRIEENNKEIEKNNKEIEKYEKKIFDAIEEFKYHNNETPKKELLAVPNSIKLDQYYTEHLFENNTITSSNLALLKLQIALNCYLYHRMTVNFNLRSKEYEEYMYMGGIIIILNNKTMNQHFIKEYYTNIKYISDTEIEIKHPKILHDSARSVKYDFETKNVEYEEINGLGINHVKTGIFHRIFKCLNE